MWNSFKVGSQYFLSTQISNLFSSFSQPQSETAFSQIESLRQLNLNEDESLFLISNDDIEGEEPRVSTNFDLVPHELTQLLKGKYVLYEDSKGTEFTR